MNIIRGYALAPKVLVDSKQHILFMYREQPDNLYDSGWRFFSGTESDEYVNDPQNIGLYDILTIQRCDPEIIPYLDSPIGSVFSRTEAGLPFVKE